MQQKREKIRKLYDEIDELDSNLRRAGKKNEREKIRQRLGTLRQEVARLLEPAKNEGSVQASLNRTAPLPLTTNVEDGSFASPLGRGRVVERAPSEHQLVKVEQETSPQNTPKSSKELAPKSRQNPSAQLKNRVKDLDQQIRATQDQILAEAVKYRRAAKAGHSPSKMTLNALFSKKKQLEKKRNEAQRLSSKAFQPKKKRARSKQSKRPKATIARAINTRNESKEQRQARQRMNAAYVARFQSDGRTRGYYVESDKEKRYWFNEED